MAEIKKEKFLLKDHLFNKQKVEKIANEIHKVYPKFDKNKFIKLTLGKFSELELKERISWIRDMLREFLPEDFKEATRILLKALPPANDNTKTDNDFGDFIYAPYADFVARFCCSKTNLSYSLSVLKEITIRFSAEDSIRYFINSFPEETLKIIESWSLDPHYHVRRLASEGTRPRLPWSQKINISVEKTIPILDNLYTDSTRFVTRSVANHLNDISKTNPQLVLKTLKRWKKSAKQSSTELDFIIKHALRSLIKQGNPEALKFLNYSPDIDIVISDLKLKNKKVTLDDFVEFEFGLISKTDVQLIIDYSIFFRDKSGTKFNRKVFKLKKTQLKKDSEVMISKRHRMTGNMTTRKLYPGKQRIEIQVNGKKMGMVDFELITE